MKKAFLIILVVVSCIASCQEYMTLDEIYSKYNKGNVSYNSLDCEVTPLFFEGNISDTSFYKLNIQKEQYIYIKVDKGDEQKDILLVKDREILICTEMNGNNINLDLDVNQIEAFGIDFFNKKYICLITGGTGLYKSGSFQEIRFYILIDLNTPIGVVTTWSRANSELSFININNDDNIDFLQLVNNPDVNNRYFIKASTISSGKLNPMNRNNLNIELEKSKDGRYKIINNVK